MLYKPGNFICERKIYFLSKISNYLIQSSKTDCTKNIISCDINSIFDVYVNYIYLLDEIDEIIKN